MKHSILACLALLALPSCSSGGAGQANDAEDTHPFAAIGEGEVVHFIGTEPFWGGEVSGGKLRYTTPEDVQGTMIDTNRFAGRNGVSFVGQYEGQDFVLAVTPGNCLDGMSDRTYPYVSTLMIAGKQREGCAWTDEQLYKETQAN